MHELQIVTVATTPRFPTVGELLDKRRNRLTDNDIHHRVVKLKTDANVAMHQIDKALTPEPVDHYEHGVRHADLEYSHHTAGRILGIQ
ncbi:hypothetical protein A5719_03340 [Mycolicibacterium peregrinum]|uniref:hypothetical protein n=1 Tax=Mycolicibacterium peregrinum TaxID=43304 RepID=UPI0007EA0258|nr:hypothetical protein [Mycolicibacterium peregrinum]OBF42573.1 hypothetical protein A5719_03340 [Mycolicibacterium peregrinum]